VHIKSNRWHLWPMFTEFYSAVPPEQLSVARSFWKTMQLFCSKPMTSSALPPPALRTVLSMRDLNEVSFWQNQQCNSYSRPECLCEILVSRLADIGWNPDTGKDYNTGLYLARMPLLNMASLILIPLFLILRIISNSLEALYCYRGADNDGNNQTVARLD